MLKMTSFTDTARPWLAAVLLLALYRLALILFADLPQDYEEFYYLYWTTQLDVGYFSKPPMLSWLIWAMTQLFGVSEAVLKSLSLLLHSATALVVYLIGRRIGLTAATAGAAALVFQTLPIVSAMSLYTTTDAPLMLFWALTLYAFLAARDSDRLSDWLWCGLFAGLGLLSKYSMVILLAGLLAYLLFTAVYRPLLRSPRLWLGVALALALLSINLLWNLQHGFITFQHTAEISQLERELFHLDQFTTFLIDQVKVFGPLLSLAVLALLLDRQGWLDPNRRLLLFASLAMLLLISLQALLARANMNWASPSYIGLALFVTAGLWSRWRVVLWLGVVVNLLFAVTMLYHQQPLAERLGVTLNAKSDLFSDRRGWRELGQQVKEWVDSHPDAILVSDSRPFMAYMSFLGTSFWPRQIAGWMPSGQVRNQFDLMGDVSRYPSASFLFISPHASEEMLRKHFDEVIPIGVMRQPVYADLSREAHGYVVSGFKGY